MKIEDRDLESESESIRLTVASHPYYLPLGDQDFILCVQTHGPVFFLLNKRHTRTPRLLCQVLDHRTVPETSPAGIHSSILLITK